MELKLNIGYHELIDLIKQLPANQIRKLQAELTLITPEDDMKNRINDFQEFLLKGSIMDEDQYQKFLSNRNYFNEWRKR